MGDDRIRKLIMPQWGFSMTHGRVVEWLLPEGSSVTPGDEVLEVETEKSVGTVEALAGGTLRRHVAKIGQEIPVGGLLALLADDSVTDEEIDRYVAGFAAPVLSTSADSNAAGPEFTDVNGRRLRHLKQGRGGQSPVVLVHGFAGNLNNWLFNHAALASDRVVYALDLPGHGQSSRDVGDGSLETLAEILGDWLDAIGLSRVHIVGHSWGGGIALALALRSPDRLMSCTLIASTALGDEIDADFLAGVVEAGRRKELRAYLERLFADPSRATRQLVNDILKFKRVDGVREALITIAGRIAVDGRQTMQFRDDLQRLTTPMLVVWGEQDKILPASQAENLSAHCTVKVLRNCGHMVQMEAAGEVNRLVSEFFQQTERPQSSV